MKTPNLSQTFASARFRGGFTLVEMLAVIAVMTILMTAGIVGMKSASSNKGPSAGIAIADSLLEEARTLAQARGTNTRLYIHAEYVPVANRKTGAQAREGKRYLSYMAVAYAELDDDRRPTDKWIIDEQGVQLPEDTYFHPELSGRDGALVEEASVDLPGRANSSVNCYYYEFNPQGRLVSPDADGESSTARFVVAGGILPEGTGDPLPIPRRAGERNYAGVVIWPTGRTSLIRDFDELDGGSAAN